MNSQMQEFEQFLGILMLWNSKNVFIYDMIFLSNYDPYDAYFCTSNLATSKQVPYLNMLLSLQF
jgi:hypothetical protein